MIQELIYTSVPSGLDPSKSGFTIAAATAGMSRPLSSALERLSGYTFAFNLSDPRADQNPPNFMHVHLQASQQTFSVLSRVGFAGSDYSGRANKIAHHFLVPPDQRTANGPARALASLQQTALMTSYDQPAESLDPRSASILQQHCEPDTSWLDALGGDRGHAGLLARSFANDSRTPALVVFQPGMNILGLFAAALDVLGPEKRWDVTFSTYFDGSLPASVHCHWRGILAGSSQMSLLSRYPKAAVIDLTQPPAALPDDPYIQAARSQQPIGNSPSATPAGTKGKAAGADKGVINVSQALRGRPKDQPASNDPYGLADEQDTAAPAPQSSSSYANQPVIVERSGSKTPLLILAAAAILLLLGNAILGFLYLNTDAKTDSLAATNAGLQARLEELENKKPEPDAKLQKDLNDAMARSQELQEDKDTLEKQIKEIKRQLDEKDEALASAKEAIEEKKEELQERQREVTGLEERIIELEKPLASAQGGQASDQPKEDPNPPETSETEIRRLVIEGSEDDKGNLVFKNIPASVDRLVPTDAPELGISWVFSENDKKQKASVVRRSGTATSTLTVSFDREKRTCKIITPPNFLDKAHWQQWLLRGGLYISDATQMNVVKLDIPELKEKLNLGHLKDVTWKLTANRLPHQSAIIHDLDTDTFSSLKGLNKSQSFTTTEDALIEATDDMASARIKIKPTSYKQLKDDLLTLRNYRNEYRSYRKSLGSDSGYSILFKKLTHTFKDGIGVPPPHTGDSGPKKNHCEQYLDNIKNKLNSPELFPTHDRLTKSLKVFSYTWYDMFGFPVHQITFKINFPSIEEIAGTLEQQR